jgi:hypothetical protein
MYKHVIDVSQDHKVAFEFASLLGQQLIYDQALIYFSMSIDLAR